MVLASSISGKTIVCGIIGDPVEHSLSPALHNAALKVLGLDYVYAPFHVVGAQLRHAIDGMRALGLRGLNVTVPHKVDVIPMLDRVDSLANKIGAVNTIINDSGHLTGYNTDATGFIQALLEIGLNPDHKKVTVIGAGGAARAIVFALAQYGAKVVILNRSPARAQELAGRVSKAFKRTSVSNLALDTENLRKALDDSELIVNTTSVGMAPEISATPVPADLLNKSHIVFDIVYNPSKTRLLQEAEAAGARIVTGVDMLVYQGAAAFEKWTGRTPPVVVMKSALLEAMRED